jgi:hypothetical protein
VHKVSRLGPLPFRLIEVAATPKGRRPRNGGPYSFFAASSGGRFLDVKPGAGNSGYQTCERSQRQDSRPNFLASGEFFAEILAVPVIPSRNEPSGLENSTTTAK